MIAIYIACFVLGGGLVVLSALTGGDHGGHGGDGSVEHGIEHGGDHGEGHAGDHDGPWIPFLSLRFWTFTLAFFGLMGLAVRFLVPVAFIVELGAALTVGLISGLSVSWAVRKLQRTSVDSSVPPRELIGREATVLLPVSGERPGKVRLRVGARQIDILANSDETSTLEAGEPVVVVDLDGARVRVVRPDTLLATPSQTPGTP